MRTLFLIPRQTNERNWSKYVDPFGVATRLGDEAWRSSSATARTSPRCRRHTLTIGADHPTQPSTVPIPKTTLDNGPLRPTSLGRPRVRWRAARTTAPGSALTAPRRR